MGVVTLGMTGPAGLERDRRVPGGPGAGYRGLRAWKLLLREQGLTGAFFGIVTLALAFVFERIAISSAWLGGMNGLMSIPACRRVRYELYDPLLLYFGLLAFWR